MRFPIRAALAAAMLATATGAYAAEVPSIDVSGTCKPLSSDVQLDTDRCLKSEQEARAQLAKEWDKFSSAERALCTKTATMGGTASYVELITCLELQRDVAKRPAGKSNMETKPSSLRQQR